MWRLCKCVLYLEQLSWVMLIVYSVYDSAHVLWWACLKLKQDWLALSKIQLMYDSYTRLWSTSHAIY